MTSKELGIREVMFHKKVGLSIEEMVSTSWIYKKLRNFRAGIEGVISFLKRVFGAGRCRWKGLPSFKASATGSRASTVDPSWAPASRAPTELSPHPTSPKAAFDNVNGEKGLSVLLEAHGVDRERAADAAAGWGGDRFAVLTPPHWKGSVGGAIGIALTAWDDEADAIESSRP